MREESRKTAVIYYSKTGFTEKYAKWLAEETNGECIPYARAQKMDFSEYDVIVFGSWCHAGFIKNLKWFKKNLPRWQEKKKIVFAVGGSPADNPSIPQSLRNNFNDAEWEQIKTFYCPGGFCYERMDTKSKLMMKMFCKMLSAKKNPTEEEKIMAKMISHSYDISDKKYILPITEWLKE